MLMANRKMIKFVQIGNTVFTSRDVSPGVAEVSYVHRLSLYRRYFSGIERP
jgi:predicted ATP-grasp superfamily ATP-dependent carboligase